ncbi:MAG: ABC transporter permease subunit [Deltaproteobacteria bacterium]|nr:ABC transporter permease subunit [Deltaproteobacteria bacterium]
MKRVWAVWKKELRSYFVSPIAYVVCTGFLVITGYFFYNNIIYYGILSLQAQSNPYMIEHLNVTEMVIYPIFVNASIVFIFLVPLLTMRLFSEEKKAGTIEFLLTYPVRDIEALLGKFGACLSIYLLILGLDFFHPLIVAAFGKPELGPLISGYLGLFLLGVAFISFGIFASSLTENQIVAAVITFGGILLFWGLGWSKDLVPTLLGDILAHLSLLNHLRSFAKGVIEVKGVVYYLSFSFFFLFLTMRSLESKRWRG